MRDNRKGPRHRRITAHSAVELLEKVSTAAAIMDGDDCKSRIGEVRRALGDLRFVLREHIYAELAKPRRARK